MTPEELARIQQLLRDQVAEELRDVAAAFDREDPPDDVLELFEALQARSDELDAIDAEEADRVKRITEARKSIQQKRKAVVYDRPDDGGGESIMDAFDSFLRTGQANQDITELRDVSPGGFRAAQSEGTGSEGGYLVPEEMANRMVDRLLSFGGVMKAAEVMNTSNGNTITWPDLNDTANEGELVAENAAAASGADLAFTKHEIGAYRFDSVGTGGSPLRVSRELLEDSMFNIAAMIEKKLPQRIMRHVSGKFINGTGANEPQGLLYGLTGIEINADTDGITFPDLIDFIHSVDPAYRELNNCSWVMNDTTWGLIEQMVDSAGNPLWTNAGGGQTIGEANTSPRLKGYPVVIDQACLDIVVADNTVNWGAFGDIAEGFVIRLVSTPSVLVDPYTRMANGQIQYVASQRMDSIRNDTSAYVALTGEA